MLAHHWVVLAQGQALRRRLRVLARDVEEARSSTTHHLDHNRLELSLRHPVSKRESECCSLFIFFSSGRTPGGLAQYPALAHLDLCYKD